MQKPASQIFRESATLFDKDDTATTPLSALAIAAGMNKEQLDEATKELRDDYDCLSSARLCAIADFLEMQEEAEGISKPSYDELYAAAIECLAKTYDYALSVHVKYPSEDVFDLEQYEEYQIKKIFIASIFGKDVIEILRDVRRASRLLELYF